MQVQEPSDLMSRVREKLEVEMMAADPMVLEQAQQVNLWAAVHLSPHNTP
jgi:hypothetical protein